jgi:hypothetical protein
MILERSVQIGLGQMPGVAGFSEKAKISQLQDFNHSGLFLKVFLPGVFTYRRMNQE